MQTMLIAAAAVVLLFLVYLAQACFAPKLSAIALATSKSEMAQPMFLIVVCMGTFLLILFLFVPYNTFGEDIKMLKDSGLTLIMVLCIIQAVWAASTSISEEIEGRTALTVLSKPIGRRQFILGKFLGIVWTVGFIFIFLGLVFLVIVAYKPVYDSRETANLDPVWQEAHLEMVRTVPGLVLAFMETVVLAAVSVALSTRLPMLANFIICFAIYVLGHLTPLIVQTSVNEFEPVRFVAQLIATVLPVLDHFNIQAAVAAGVSVPHQYLGAALLYCIIYSTIAMLLALALFEDRDLA
jgi:ABC-type transport system involved in multi-copper enzyme maturation permease subunit